ncbi:SGNH/GDSL hydrolase family protein [Nonomuraea sp. NPDC050404]|uniref:SGNH/GDSL hydrolase family protein n=1 Tax=Nonomuraea sp. NPDC050404 TaxID=3155783 RepID=UPI0033E4F36E
MMFAGSLPVLPVQAAPVPLSGTAEPPPVAAAVRNATREPVVDAIDPGARDEMMGDGWQASKDMAWTTSGDAEGLHLLVAEARTGYAWRTAATLTVPGFETDRWIGNVCLTGSGRRAVVVYAPREFTNREELFQRGGFAAVVDLAKGSVRRLDVGVSLAYHNPGCGADERVVLSQSGGQRLGATRLHVLDTVTGESLARHELAGQVTGAVPVGDRIVAAGGEGLLEVGRDGKISSRAEVKGLPFSLRPDADGGISFLRVHDEQTAVAEHLAAGERQTREFARGPLTDLALAPGSGGRAFLTGEPAQVTALPDHVTQVRAAMRAEVSTTGRMSLTHDGSHAGPGQLVRLRGHLTTTGAVADFRLLPGGAATKPAGTKGGQAGGRAAIAAGSPTDPVDSQRTCSIARNDSRRQVIQPHWRQVEWAANLAVQGALTVQRPANWHQSGLSAWSPQGLFPSRSLKGGGRVPAQIMLGILAQESNMWQASGRALEGVAGNPLVGDYYGNRETPDGWTVIWGEADCGYGVAQVTDGMRVGQRSETSQRAIALDYATNIAAGLQILQEKWNHLYDHVKINNADPSRMENWFAAVWAYNTGVQPGSPSMGNPTGCKPGPACTDPDGNWGLGWSNNPVNPDYPANRLPFLENDPDDARTPNLWPYPEKVLGWAAYPIVKTDWRDDSYDAGYYQAWWTEDLHRTQAKPPRGLFCNAGNLCDASRAQPCGSNIYHCWWHQNATWKSDCAATCGYENLRFEPGTAEPQFGSGGLFAEHYPPNCEPFRAGGRGSNTLPSNALIIDDVPDSVPSVRPNCPRTWTSKGSFALDFAPDRFGAYRSKIDFHQIGGGFGGHFWFTHTQQWSNTAHQVTGTWTLDQQLHGWARVLVHLPDQGAHTQQAVYTVDLGNGKRKKRAVLQRAQEHRWVSLGVFAFDGIPKVSLSNLTDDGEWVEDIAWDAIAFQPLPAKPRHLMVSLGDSYASGEGASTDARTDYYAETDDDGDRVKGTYNNPNYTWKYGNACHRSKHSWPRMAVAADHTRSLGVRHDSWDANVDLQLHACSGAVASNIGGAGQFRELGQIAKGYLDENTTLVTLSIGGNDARFVPILQFCASPGQVACPAQIMPGDTVPLRDSEPALITTKVKASVVAEITDIARAAPNAKIVLMGYPILFEDDASCVPYIDHVEGSWLNEIGALLSTTMREAAAQADAALPDTQVVFADPVPDFQGKAVCAEPSAIHGIILDRTQGESPSFPGVISQQSFHPTIWGAGIFATTLNRTLRQLGM